MMFKKTVDNPRAIIVVADDWEGLYVHGNLFREEHKLGEGCTAKFWLRVAELFGLKPEDLITICIEDISDEDADNLDANGCLPRKLSEFKGTILC